MKKIFVNFLSAKSGGGRVIFENFLEHVNCDSDYEIHLLCPLNFNLENKNLIEVPAHKWMKKKIGLLWLYFYYIPNYCKFNEIENILNFGDIILPRLKNQTYFFDWAYLLLEDNKVWRKMSFKNRLFRFIKSKFIYLFKDNNSSVIVQSKGIEASFIKSINFSGTLKVLPTPINFNDSDINNLFYDINDNDLVYISNYAPHKNFEIIPSVALKLKKMDVSCRFILTLDVNSPNWERIYKSAHQLDVLDMVITIGSISQVDVFTVLKNSKALFFPSLLESYGIPIFESMSVGTPVLTSNSPFIKSICGDSVIYFNPEDKDDIANTIKLFFDNAYDPINREKEVLKVLNKIPNWDEYIRMLLKYSVKLEG